MELRDLNIIDAIWMQRKSGYVKKNIPQTGTKFGKILSIGAYSIHCENGTVNYTQLEVKDVTFDGFKIKITNL